MNAITRSRLKITNLQLTHIGYPFKETYKLKWQGIGLSVVKISCLDFYLWHFTVTPSFLQLWDSNNQLISHFLVFVCWDEGWTNGGWQEGGRFPRLVLQACHLFIFTACRSIGGFHSAGMTVLMQLVIWILHMYERVKLFFSLVSYLILLVI